ncbi:MAG: OmpA family protein [Cytophagales bacterium]|nr:OmpA family protein [Cytophagales bacterium]
MNDLRLKSALLFIAFAACTHLCLAQNDKKLEKQYNRGLEMLYDEEFANAKATFEGITAVNPNYKDVPYRLEVAAFLSGDSNRPLDNLLSFRTTLAKKDKFYHYWLGRVYVSKYLFEEAIGSWSNFLRKDVYKSKEIRQETNDFISSTQTLSDFFHEHADYVVTLLPETINTEKAEVNPAFNVSNRQLLYSTSSTASGKEEFEIRGSNVISGDIVHNLEWSEPVRIPTLNSIEKNNTRFCLTYWQDHVEVLVAKNSGEIFESPLINGEWQTSERAHHQIKLAHLGPDFTVNRKQDRIIYSSSKDLKKSGMDLYEIRFDSVQNKWGEPIAISRINSESDESSPFLTVDERTLYFASDGHHALGGFDIFYSKWDKTSQEWGDPVQMSYPINTPDDEIHFKLAADGASGYFSSNRVYSRGDFDIFHFEAVPKLQIAGNVLTKNDQTPIAGASVIFTPHQYVNERYTANTNEAGLYDLQIFANEHYDIKVTKDGKVLLEQEMKVGDQFEDKIDFLIDPTGESSMNVVAAATPFTKPETQNVREGLIVAPPKKEETKPAPPSKQIPNRTQFAAGSKLLAANLYFQKNSSQLVTESRALLKEYLKTLERYSHIKVEAGGHTDSLGPAADNLALSLTRARIIKDWLTKNGIDPDRISIKGYGESQPLSTNDDEEDGRELNRRVEIRVISASF